MGEGFKDTLVSWPFIRLRSGAATPFSNTYSKNINMSAQPLLLIAADAFAGCIKCLAADESVKDQAMIQLTRFKLNVFHW